MWTCVSRSRCEGGGAARDALVPQRLLYVTIIAYNRRRTPSHYGPGSTTMCRSFVLGMEPGGGQCEIADAREIAHTHAICVAEATAVMRRGFRRGGIQIVGVDSLGAWE
jgi:hypothetical protein